MGNSIPSFLLLIASLGRLCLLSLLPPQPLVYINMLFRKKETKNKIPIKTRNLRLIGLHMLTGNIIAPVLCFLYQSYSALALSFKFYLQMLTFSF